MALIRRNAADLFSLVSADVELHRASSTRGGEYYGSCPICGGKNRLRVQPEMNLWWCRQCANENRMVHWEDDIGWLQRIKGMSFKDACSLLEITFGWDDEAQYTSIKPHSFPDPCPTPPSEEWQEAVKTVVQDAHLFMLREQGEPYREWLLQERGITEETIKYFCLGWLEKERYITDPEYDASDPDDHEFIKFPPGLIIPLIGVDSLLWGVKVRLDPEYDHDNKRYSSISGSRSGLIGRMTGKDKIILCEGELDMMLTWQECHESMQVDIATYGGAQTINLHDYWYTYLRYYKTVFIGYDQDEPGRAGSQKLHTRLDQDIFYGTPTKIVNMYYPYGWLEVRLHGDYDNIPLKDLTDMHQSAILKPFLRLWMEPKHSKTVEEPKKTIVTEFTVNYEQLDTDTYTYIRDRYNKTSIYVPYVEIISALVQLYPAIDIDETLDILVISGKIKKHNGKTYYVDDGNNVPILSTEGTTVDGPVDSGPSTVVPMFAGYVSNTTEERGNMSTNLIYIQTPDTLREALVDIGKHTHIALDTETVGLDPYEPDGLSLVQIGTLDGKMYVINARDVDISPLKPILEDRTIHKILQNANFDYRMLKQQRGIAVRGMIDTMLAERVLKSGISREANLDFLSRLYTGIPLDKSVRSTFINYRGPFSTEQLAYSSMDVEVLFAIWDKQRKALIRENTLHIAELEFQCLVPVSEMQLAGLKIDETQWRAILTDTSIKKAKTLTELLEALSPTIYQRTLWGDIQPRNKGAKGKNVAHEIVLTSAKEMLVKLHELGQYEIDHGNTGIGEELLALESSEEQFLHPLKHPAVQRLLDYRGYEKIGTSFGENILALIHPITKRIHPEFQQLEADTGRFSCRSPNVQQIPHDSAFRDCFVAREGYKIITSDYSGCIAEDSIVTLNNTWVKIQDHPDAIFKGNKETVLVQTKHGYSIVCTPDHKILTSKGWVEARNLTKKDFVALQGLTFDRNTLCNAESDYYWLIGFWAGDGSFGSGTYESNGGKYSVTCPSFARSLEPDDSFIINEVWRILDQEPTLFKQSFHIKNQREFGEKVLGLFNKKDLRIPFTQVNINQLACILSGLFDADGSVSKKDLHVATKYEYFAKDIQTALLYFGIFSNLNKTIGGKCWYAEGKPYYRVTIHDPISINNFQKYIGLNIPRKNTQLHELSLRRSTSKSSTNYVPITVDSIRKISNRYKSDLFNYIHGRLYTRFKVDIILKENGITNIPKDFECLQYHWDYIDTVNTSSIKPVWDLMDQPNNKFSSNGIIVHNCELRVLAEMSQDPAFLDAFNSGQDLHARTASQMYGVTMEYVAANKQLRQAAKCFHPDTEVLTKNGWRKITEITTETAIVQAVPYNCEAPVLSWAYPTEVFTTKHPSGKITHITSENTNICVTEDHRMLVYDRKHRYKVTIPDYVHGRHAIAAAGILTGKCEASNEECRLLALAILAIFHGRINLNKRTIKFNVVNRTEHISLRSLLQYVPYTKTIEPYGGYDQEVYIIHPQAAETILTYLDDGKLSWDMLKYGPKTWEYLKHIFKQVNTSANGRIQYQFTCGKQNSEVLQALFSIHGYRTRIIPEDNMVHLIGNALYTVRVYYNWYGLNNAIKRTVTDFTDEVACLSVPSTFVLTRFQGTIAVTGQTINFGLAYGQGPGRLANSLGLSIDEGRALVQQYFKSYQGIKKWLDQAARFSVNNLYSQTIYGRKRYYHPLPPKPSRDASQIEQEDWRKAKGRIERQGKNGPIQGANADMTKLALIYIHKALEGYDARLINTVHDEIVVEAREDQAPEVLQIVESNMVKAGEVMIKSVPVLVDAHIDDHWSKG